MKVVIRSPFSKLFLGALLLPVFGCGTSDTTGTSATNTSPVPAQGAIVASTPTLAPKAPKSAAQIKYLYSNWKQSWADMRIDDFMAFYSPKVRSGKVGYAGIRERKIRQWAKESYIQITDVGQPKIHVKGNHATLSALQEYNSATSWDKGIKSLTWQKSNGRWLIVQESFKVQSQRYKTAPVVAAPPPINQIVESQPVPNNALNTDGSSKPTRRLNTNRDYDCSDFTTHAEAQAFFNAQTGAIRDPHRLDEDGDGLACEDLP